VKCLPINGRPLQWRTPPLLLHCLQAPQTSWLMPHNLLTPSGKLQDCSQTAQRDKRHEVEQKWSKNEHHSKETIFLKHSWTSFAELKQPALQFCQSGSTGNSLLLRNRTPKQEACLWNTDAMATANLLLFVELKWTITAGKCSQSFSIHLRKREGEKQETSAGQSSSWIIEWLRNHAPDS